MENNVESIKTYFFLYLFFIVCDTMKYIIFTEVIS